MHWLGYNDTVSWLNKAKTRIFQPTAKFEYFKIYLYFVCLPAVRPGCTRCRAPEISHDKGNGSGFTKMLLRRHLTTAPLVVCNTAHFEYHVSPQLSCSIRYCITILLIVIREKVCHYLYFCIVNVSKFS